MPPPSAPALLSSIWVSEILRVLPLAYSRTAPPFPSSYTFSLIVQSEILESEPMWMFMAPPAFPALLPVIQTPFRLIVPVSAQ